MSIVSMDDISIFPDGISLVEHAGIHLVGSFNELAVRETIRNLPGRWEIIYVPFHDHQEYCLAMLGMEIYPFPRRSNSVDSEAYYLAELARRGEKWLLQSLEPNQKTSCHDHPVEVETFYSIAGEATLRTPEHDLMLRGRETHCVAAGVPHEIHTGPSAALTLIHITNIMNGLHAHNFRPRIRRDEQ